MRLFPTYPLLFLLSFWSYLYVDNSIVDPDSVGTVSFGRIRIDIVKWENGSEKKNIYKNTILFLKINHFFGYYMYIYVW